MLNLNSKGVRASARTFRFCLGLVNLLAFTALFVTRANQVFPHDSPWGFLTQLPKIEFMPALMRLDLAVLAAILVLTVLFGRFYCEVMCPLGVWQDVLRCAPRLGSVRRVCCKLPVSRPQWIVRAVFVLLAVAAPWLFDPYAIFGRGLTGAEMILFLLVSVLALIGRGRIWCNWICPVGTFFALTQLPRRNNAKFTQFNAHCKDCRACMIGKGVAK